MAKTILVVGKEMPAGNKFTDGLSLSGRSISITGPEEENTEETLDDTDKIRKISEASGIAVVEWHKSSPISSKTVILRTESIFGNIDEAVIYFDEEWFASIENQLSVNECIHGCDELILPFQIMTLEILSRFEKRNSSGVPGFLIFMIKETPDLFDVQHSPGVKNGSSPVASPVVAAAASAFMAFAENIAVLYGGKSYVNILLVRGDAGGEVSASDVEFAKWLCSYLDSVEEAKTELDAKLSANWIEAGKRYISTNGFSLFGKKKK